MDEGMKKQGSQEQGGRLCIGWVWRVVEKRSRSRHQGGSVWDVLQEIRRESDRKRHKCVDERRKLVRCIPER